MAAFTATFISFLFLFPNVCWGKVLSDDISEISLETFSLKQFCQEMVPHPAPLIEIKSIAVVDCMGKKVKVSDFCLKKMTTDPYYLRGYARNNQVECLSGKKVIFKYACKKNDSLCKADARSACTQLKSKLAYRLDLVHHSLISKDSFKQLNCFYESLPLSL